MFIDFWNRNCGFIVVFVYFVAAIASASMAFAQISDNFRESSLDYSIWCDCQIDKTLAPLRFSKDETSDGFVSISVNSKTIGKNSCTTPERSKCRRAAQAGGHKMLLTERHEESLADSDAPLGPSFFGPERSPNFLFQKRSKNPFCDAKGDKLNCLQRQELRLSNRLRHGQDQARTYQLRFRLPKGAADQEHSIRWVVAQWKTEPPSKQYDKLSKLGWTGVSPFLAVRYDDSTLHLTIQDEHCRCLIASAVHPTQKLPLWTDGKPQSCMSTHPKHDGQHMACDSPSQVSLKYGRDPVLKNPRGTWTSIRVLTGAVANGGYYVEVYQDDRFIVKAIGSIGYDVEPGAEVKFKLGIYRDFQPTEDAIEVDGFILSNKQ
ncbi:MAG: heparin lyase I family protein [Pseudomonadota bacterium]